MKKYKLQIILVVAVAAMYSCNGDIYDNINEMVDSGTVYPAAYKQQYVIARSGTERVEIDLDSIRLSASEMARRMPKAKKTVVEYGDVRLVIDSVCSWVNVTNLTVPNTYRFVIYTENEWGDKSIPVEVRQKPFTSADREALVFTSSATASVSTGIVNITPAPELYTLYSVRYSYTDRDDVKQSGETKGLNFILNNLKSGASTVTNVSCQLLPIGAIDTVWLDGNVELKTMTQAAFDNYLNETEPFPRGTHHILSAAAPLTLLAADFDYGGNGKAWFKNGRYMSGSAYRRDNGDSDCLVGFGYGGPSYPNDIQSAQPGDWLAYTIEVQDPGEYNIECQYATAVTNSKAIVTFDALDYTGAIPLPYSGSDWKISLWANLGTPVYLDAGKHKVKFTMVDRECGLHYLRFTKVQ
ncbi:hypothetical protein AGMMS50239_28260 [Bacteroidia bacterium]|nr:hypothetical protein AGMMS50239_28260 [Bacteroidia bacterium]